MPVVGEQIHGFELYNQDGNLVRLSDFAGKKIIVFAFPKAATEDSTTQAVAFRDNMAAFESANAVVLGISADMPDDLKAWRDEHNLSFDLLSDPTHEVLSAWDAWGEMDYKGRSFEAPIRSYWVINESGMVIDAQVRVMPEDSVRQALAAVEDRYLKARK